MHTDAMHRMAMLLMWLVSLLRFLHFTLVVCAGMSPPPAPPQTPPPHEPPPPPRPPCQPVTGVLCCFCLGNGLLKKNVASDFTTKWIALVEAKKVSLQLQDVFNKPQKMGNFTKVPFFPIKFVFAN